MFVKMPSISSFAHTKRKLDYNNISKVTYGCKIKLHGTNASVRIGADGTVHAQNRNLTSGVYDGVTYKRSGEKHFGFNDWVERYKDEWREMRHYLTNNESITVYGEWAGKGVQRKDAVTKLDRKYFFVFAAFFSGQMVTCPTLLEKICPDIDNLVVLPWHHKPIEVDLDNKLFLSTYLSLINESVSDIGEVDPFIRDTFGIEGPGEGLVGVPVADGLSYAMYELMTWKAKCAAHAVKHSTKAASEKIEIPASVTGLADMLVTEARCQQAATEVGGVLPEKTGNFIRWIWEDIQKEAEVEISAVVATGADLKGIRKTVERSAALWYREAQNKLV